MTPAKNGENVSVISRELLGLSDEHLASLPRRPLNWQMAKQKQKLELTWIGKENHSKLEPRVLQEVPEFSYHASHRDLERVRWNRLCRSKDREWGGSVRVRLVRRVVGGM